MTEEVRFVAIAAQVRDRGDHGDDDEGYQVPTDDTAAEGIWDLMTNRDKKLLT